MRNLKVAIVIAWPCALGVATAVAAHQMPPAGALQAAPLLVPLAFWLPLGVGIFATQTLLAALCLRSTRRELTLCGLALALTDVVLVALIRRCVAAMGRMDYSETFFQWRWLFLGLMVILVGLPIPLWALAVWIAHGRHTRPAGSVPLIHPVFRAGLASWLAAGAIVLAAGSEFSLLPRAAHITRVEVTPPALPPQLDGLRLAVLADHHVGPLMSPERARRRLASFPHTRPDLVIELGDITEMDPRYQPQAARIVGECKAPLGTFAVAGNFDVQCGTDTLRQELAKAGVRYLENRAARVSARGADLWIVGVGDPWTGQDDLDRALAAVPEGATAILLSHSPDIIERAVARQIPLMLSGHLHGGQVVVPFAGPAVGMSRYGTRFAWGHFHMGATHLVMSRGLGEEALPLRLFCPPEIVLVTLRAAAE